MLLEEIRTVAKKLNTSYSNIFLLVSLSVCGLQRLYELSKFKFESFELVLTNQTAFLCTLVCILSSLNPIWSGGGGGGQMVPSEGFC